MSLKKRYNDARSFRSLTVTLTIAFLIPAFTILILASLFVGYFNFRLLKKAVADDMQIRAENAAFQVQNFLQAKAHALTAATEASGLFALPRNKQLQIFETLFASESALSGLVLLDAKGNTLLTESRSGQGAFFLITDEQIRSVLAGADVFFDIYDGESLIIAVPVSDPESDGGVVAARVDIKSMRDVVSGIRAGDRGVVYVVDRQGNLIAFEDATRALRRENVIDLKAVSEFAEKGREKQPDVRSSKGIYGTDVIASYAPLKNPDWAVIVELPVFEAYAPIIASLEVLMVVFVAGLFMAITAAIYIAKIITRPIVSLRDTAVKLGEGKLDTRIYFDFNNEIAQLANDFNEMAEAIETRTRQIKEEQTKLVSSINSLSLGFALVDRNHRVMLANRTMHELFGSESINLKRVGELLGDVKEFLDQANLCLKTKSPVQIKEVSFQNRFFEISFTPVIAEQSELPLGYVALFRDITEYKLLDIAKSEFIAIASHEMRTPLTIIRGNVELLIEQTPSSKNVKSIRKMMNSIRDNCIRLMDIVNDFLDLTQLEEGKVEFQKEPVEIESFVQEIASDFAPSLAAKGLAISMIAPSSEIAVVADRGYLRQVVINLISNAIHNTDNGGITISFQELGGSAKVLVSDTGVGIDPARRTFLFQKFKTVGKDFIKSKEYGSGLGLYIGRLLMESMGGRIDLEKSELGIGSTFSITLPRSQPTQPPSPARAKK